MWFKSGLACSTRNDENNWKRNPLNGEAEIEFDEKWIENDKRYRMKYSTKVNCVYLVGLEFPMMLDSGEK